MDKKINSRTVNNANNKMFVVMAMYFTLLALFLIMSMTNFFVRDEDTDTVCRMTVIICEGEDEYYTRFKKGVEKAAEDERIDVNFSSIYKDSGLEQLKSLIIKESDLGADIIMVPGIDCAELLNLSNTSGKKIPVVMPDSVYDEGGGYVGVNYRSAIDSLVERIKESQDTSVPVYIIPGKNYIKKLCDILKEDLERAGFNVVFKQDEADENFYSSLFDTECSRWYQPPAVISLSRSGFTEMSYMSSMKETENLRLYGIGTTTYILNKMEQDYVLGIVTWNEYDEGYVAVNNSYKAIFSKDKKGLKIEDKTIPSYFIDKDILKSGKYTKMLYPIN